PVIDKEAEEPPQSRRSPSDGCGRKLRPGRSEPRQIIHRRGRQRAGGISGALKVVAISGQGVTRGPGLGGQHVEEAVDQRTVVRRHVRESASAAIIREMKSWPVRLSAAMA